MSAAPQSRPVLHRSRTGARAILFVHGFQDDHRVWEPLLESLLARDFEIVRLDLAGMGDRAGDPGPYTLERHAEDVASAVRALDKQVVLVGQSMGAQVVELAASRCPDRVDGLVLITPVPLAGTHMPAEVVAQFKSGGDPAQAPGEARKQLMVTVTQALVDRFSRSTALIRGEVVPQLVDAWDQGHADGLAPTRFRGPVLVMSGAGDWFISAEVVAKAVEPRFPQAQRAVIAHSGHWPHAEQPAATAQRLDAFLDELPA